jgi:SAM-dependent methyltransferase
LEIGAGIDKCWQHFPDSPYVTLDINRESSDTTTHFVQGNAQFLPFKKQSFDHFIAISLLEHLPNPERCLRDLRLICKRGGLVAVPTFDDFPFLYDPLNWMRLRLGLPPANFGIGGYGHVSLLSGKQWEELFSRTGFSVVRREPCEVLDVFQALEMFLVSIPISRFEYTSIMKKMKVLEGISLLGKSLKAVSKILHRVFKTLYGLNWGPIGTIGYSYYLEPK